MKIICKYSSRRTLGGLALGGLVLAACGTRTAEPLLIPYSVDFGSVSAAVYVDAVTLRVVAGAQDCVELTQRFKADPAGVAASVAQQVSTSPCAMLNQTGSDLVLPFEGNTDYTVLATGARQGKDALIGCAVQRFNGKTSPIVVPMSLISNSVSVETSRCSTLRAKCDQKC
jgi:hypothetical protein